MPTEKPASLPASQEPRDQDGQSLAAQNRAALTPVPIVEPRPSEPTRLVRQKQKSGCTVAAIAMVTGLTYDEVAAHSKRDFDNDGVQLHDWDEFLNDRGFAICLKYKVTHLQGVNTYRPLWPLPPFAPIHLCSVQSSAGAHAVVMLANGDVLDPAKDGVYKLSDYQDVHSIAGVWRIAAAPPQVPSPAGSEVSREPISAEQLLKFLIDEGWHISDGIEYCSGEDEDAMKASAEKLAHSLTTQNER